MKKKQIKIDRLTLDKETISRLNEDQLRDIAGGGGTYSCGRAEESEEEEQLAAGSCCKGSCDSHPC